jgi:hypothetical protein
MRCSWNLKTFALIGLSIFITSHHVPSRCTLSACRCSLEKKVRVSGQATWRDIDLEMATSIEDISKAKRVLAKATEDGRISVCWLWIASIFLKNPYRVWSLSSKDNTFCPNDQHLPNFPSTILRIKYVLSILFLTGYNERHGQIGQSHCYPRITQSKTVDIS